MIASHLMTTPITIVRPGRITDRYQQTRDDWSEAGAKRTTVYGFKWDNVGTEDLNGRDALIDISQVFLPPGTDIKGRDRVEIAGVSYEVTATPMQRFTPEGLHHIEARLRAVSG